ncbi:dihydrolipoamide acetyltransferase family protein [Actinocorallia libanotica]|uniref:Dihydrolipoamide acetyltransferase component of pyruvate dehydrogenase complex n=1 Tax=Actinocorallia libanotica TaxID=46162 RepID=A0ABN1QYD6_9ACTN
MVRHFRLPDVGEGLTEAEIVRWHVRPGDPVELNQTVVEIETAKAIVELPSPYEGVVAEILVEEGDTVAVGTPIIGVREPGDAAPEPPAGGEARPAAGAAEPRTPSEAKEPRTPVTEEPQPSVAEEPQTETAAPGGRTPVLVGYGVKPGSTRRRPRKPAATRPAALPPAGRALAKPPVRKLARDLGVDLSTIVGTGPEGTVTREDVRASVAEPAAPGALTEPATPTAPAESTAPGESMAPAESTAPGVSTASEEAAAPAEAAASVRERSAVPQERADEERVPVRGVRRATAAAMVSSAFSAPHVTEFLQVDVTPAMKMVERLRALPEYAESKVTPMLLVSRALLIAARRHPMINSSWDGAAGEIVVKRRVNLGVAVAAERGLLVPNLKDAHALPLPDLAAGLQALIRKARDGRCEPADLTGGTLTITNVGVFGVDAGTPILSPGEVAILAVGRIRELPWVHKGKVKPRLVTTLALSFDHRVVDGELGSAVLRETGALLEQPFRLLALG